MENVRGLCARAPRSCPLVQLAGPTHRLSGYCSAFLNASRGRCGAGSVTPWARETFGSLAGQLAEAIPACLVQAHDRARHGHEGVNTQTLEAYGHGLHAVQYEALAAGLTPFEGATAIRLQGRTVMVMDNKVIYPIRYAKKDVPVTSARLRRART